MQTTASLPGDGYIPETKDKRCPACGGLNKRSAEWCGQCFQRFASDDSRSAAADEPAGTTSQVASAPSPPPPPPSGVQGASRDASSVPSSATGQTFSVTDKGIIWTCSRCNNANDFSLSACSVCGAPFSELIREPGSDRPQRDPGIVAIASLVLPGAGHAYLGLWGQAIARAVISVWVVTVTLFAIFQGGRPALVTALMFGVVAVALWLVAAHDSYREAQGDGRSTLLKDRHFLYVVLGLLLMSMIMVFMSIAGAPQKG
jgi:hypothetical protein